MPLEGIALTTKFKVGDWTVDAGSNRIFMQGASVNLEPRTMAVLVILAQHADKVISNEFILEQVWQGQALGDNPVYKCISKLRKAFSHNGNRSVVIDTVPKKGYRLQNSVELIEYPSERQPIGWSKESIHFKVISASIALVALSLFIIAINQVVNRDSEVAAISDSSIVVLPFDNLSNTQDSVLIGEGLAEEVQNRLSTNPQLTVIASLSSMKASHLQKSFSQIAELLRVNYVLHGTIRQQKDSFKVNTRLIDRKGHIIWNEEYNSNQNEIFGLTNPISTQVFQALKLPLTSQKASQSQNQTSEAHLHYLIGRSIHQRRLTNWILEAKQEFDRALKIDPEHAGALAGRGLMTLYSQLYQSLDISVALPDIEKAINLAPNLADAQAVKGFYLVVSQDQESTEAGISHLQKAIALNPNYIYAYTWLSNALLSAGQPNEALKVLNQAIEREPLDPVLNGNWAIRQLRKGNYRAAKAKFQQILSFPDAPMYIFERLFKLYLEYGNFIEAFDVILQFEQHFGQDQPRAHIMRAQVYAILGEVQHAALYLEQVKSAESLSTTEIEDISQTLLDINFLSELESFLQSKKTGSPKNSDLLIINYFLAATYLRQNNHQEAINSLSAIQHRESSSTSTYWLDPISLEALQTLAFAYQITGERQNASDLLSKMRTIINEQNFAYPNRSALKARSYLLQGNKQQALLELEKAVKIGWKNIAELNYDPRWQGLRDLAKFKNLRAKIKASVDQQYAYLKSLYPHEFNRLNTSHELSSVLRINNPSVVTNN